MHNIFIIYIFILFLIYHKNRGINYPKKSPKIEVTDKMMDIIGTKILIYTNPYF